MNLTNNLRMPFARLWALRPKLLLSTTEKSNMYFRLLPNSLPLKNLDRQYQMIKSWLYIYAAVFTV